MQDLRLAYDTLLNVYQNGAYASLEISKNIENAQNKAFYTNLVYGAIERDIEFNYYINSMCQKKPKNAIIIVLKIGMYQIEYMDSIPAYAAVSKTVDLTKAIGKKENAGFVNAILKKFSNEKPALPKQNIDRLSVEFSTPKFIVDEYIKTYGLDKTKAMLLKSSFDLEHFRVNKAKCSYDELIKILKDKNEKYVESLDNAIYAKNDKTLQDLYSKGFVTVQSKTSMMTCEKLNPKDGDKILDLCSAPGGKSIYLSELANVEITSCDIHPHRLDLIQSYINRMGAKGISLELNDATKLNEKWLCHFDKVLCDVPCSGLGVQKKKPDIYLNMTKESIKDLPNIQYKILENASKYIKNDGEIVYSTCTTLPQENQNVVKKFLENNKEFILVDEIQYLQDKDGQDGFYIAKLKRKQ